MLILAPPRADCEMLVQVGHRRLEDLAPAEGENYLLMIIDEVSRNGTDVVDAA
jgi:hypothetical protein